ncbi:hypothetical protein [Evansella cellulosilytica]|uniref:Polymer-forming cytoskeletal protein n=1 Tax=Evansella cellulosilytica (strain ATCC 21833 / DSM 2522 / FERM P-1141 / JCM 9156 / N-4) TaxID=649639 RepID=E6U1D5_EVAC2|nr:hypothetical protein [Evansella cellulosilytica]ADU29182.1 hypothetical protein Bcell_0906 [Evansella cellulosilytica DSM 2522]
MKFKGFLLVLVLLLSVGLMAACGEDETSGDEESDATTGATQVVVTDEASFLQGISEDGAWIIILEDDLTVDEEIVLAGQFTHRDEPARKIAIYAQDADRNITDQYTLTAPKLTIESENTRLQGGTFAGDVVVAANGFSIPDATIEGNLTFASEEFEASADLSGGTVTGTVSVEGGEEADAVTGATQIMVTDAESFFHGVSADGPWIILFQDDLTVDEEVVLTGNHTHRDEPARKLALYEQDADRNITAQFTLTAPKLTIQNENTRLQGGTFVGDVYVEANNFSIPNGTIEGNVYFASEEFEASADLSEGTVTGSVEVQ